MTPAVPLLLVLAATGTPWADRCREHAAALTDLAALNDAGEPQGPTIEDVARRAQKDLSETEDGISPLVPALALVTSTGDDVAARARLAARSLGASCALAQSPPASADTTRLKDILARPEFDRAQAGPSWAMRLSAAVLDALQKLFGSDAAVEFAMFMRPAILVGVALLVLYLGFRFTRTRRAAAPAPRGESEPRILTLEEAEELRARGDAALTEGRLRDAVRAHLLALLATLERARLLRPGRARTNHECARDLASRGAPAELTASFAALARDYDRAFYGKESMEPAEARSLVQAARDVARGLP